MEAKSIETAD